jgi:hypothetical protein
VLTCSPFFCGDLLHHLDFEVALGNQLLQPRILLLLTSLARPGSLITSLPRWMWPSGASPDCEVYAYAAAIYCGVSRMDWKRLEQQVAPKTQDMFAGKLREHAEPSYLNSSPHEWLERQRKLGRRGKFATDR